MLDANKIELILLKFANDVLDVRNGKTNPTMGELIDKPTKEIIRLLEDLR
jgi:hypothetical protein